MASFTGLAPVSWAGLAVLENDDVWVGNDNSVSSRTSPLLETVLLRLGEYRPLTRDDFTAMPSLAPTSNPTAEPTARPTAEPTAEPTCYTPPP